jgi:dienelactone hydrolase
MVLGRRFVTLVAFALCTVSAEAQIVRHELLPFESAASSVADVLNGSKGQKLTLAGRLRVPKASQKPPVVILMPPPVGIGPGWGQVDEWSRVLHEAGIATFAVDSFSPRGIYTLADAIKMPLITRLPDVFGARSVLMKHPFIDANKIAVMGFSHGAPSALYSSLVRFQKQYGEVAFAGHISVYGPCGVRFRDDERLASPLLLLHGSPDNWVPAATCRDYAARLKTAGSDARLIEYADAHHAFDGPLLAKVTQYPNVTTPVGCRLDETDGGILVSAETKQPLAPTESCWIKGTSAGYNEAAAKKAHEDVKSFLKEVFSLK